MNQEECANLFTEYGYIVITTIHSIEYKAYNQWCIANKQPLIYVLHVPRRRYAGIEMLLDYTGSILTEEAQAKTLAVLAKYSKSRAWVRAWSGMALSCDVYKNCGEACARELSAIVRDSSNLQPL